MIAFISDIHGNLPALRAAFTDARRKGADRIVCAGDIVGYGPFPNEVCDFLKDNAIESISGNYDCKVLDVISNGEKSISKISKKKRELVNWTASELNKPSRRYLSSLTNRLEFTLPNGKKVLVVHGSPLSEDDDILPSITAPALKSKCGDTDVNILVSGHTHIPFIKRLAGILVVNCGSVGLPVDGDPRPSYGLVSSEEGHVHGQIVRFEYDVNETISAVKKTSLPKGIQQDFAQGSKRRYLQ